MTPHAGRWTWTRGLQQRAAPWAVVVGLLFSSHCSGASHPAARRALITPAARALAGHAPVVTPRTEASPPSDETATPTAGLARSTPSPPTETPVPATPAPTRPPDDLLRLVSKTSEPLSPSFVPPDLVPLPAGLSDPPGLAMRAEAAAAFTAMAQAASRQGLRIVAVSTYRSYWEQAQVYSDEVRIFGKEQADRESALPGRSEHQLGTTADISTPSLGYQLDDSIDKHPEGVWLAQHAVEFGFVLSYPEGKEAITGYRYEPWHYRYVGLGNARAIVASGRTNTEILVEHQRIDQPLPPAVPAPATGGCDHADAAAVLC